MLCWRPTRRAGGTALLAMALGMLCTNVILKQLVLRPRPYVTMEALIPLLTSADPNSFPVRAHLRRLCRGDGLGRSAALARWGPGGRGGPGGVYGALPALCGGPLSQRRPGRGPDRRSVRALRPVAGRPEPGPEASLTPQFSR